MREYLDIREINGYSIQFTPFHPAVSSADVTTLHDEPEGEHVHDTSSPWTGIKVTSTETVVPEPESIKCLVYIGLPENPQFLGPQDPDALARKILESEFPIFFFLCLRRSLVIPRQGPEWRKQRVSV